AIRQSCASEPTLVKLDAKAERGNDRGVLFFFFFFFAPPSSLLFSKPLAEGSWAESSCGYDLTAITSNLSPKICPSRLHDLTFGWLRHSSEVHRNTDEGQAVSLRRRKWDHELFLRLGRDFDHRQGTTSRDRR
ncbi:hypothetical protein CORC01_07299, partial [Colletotrichum orchidophilum]